MIIPFASGFVSAAAEALFEMLETSLKLEVLQELCCSDCWHGL